MGQVLLVNSKNFKVLKQRFRAHYTSYNVSYVTKKRQNFDIEFWRLFYEYHSL